MLPVYAFADDATVVANNVEHVLKVPEACERYEKISGARVNREKSEVLLLGQRRVTTNNLYGLPLKENIKILGIIFDCNGPTKQNWTRKIEEIKQSIKKLEKVSSNMFERIQISKCHLLSKIQYLTDTLDLDKHSCMAFDKLIFPFIWGGRSEAISRAWMKEQKDRGGYNIGDLSLTTRAKHIKWALRAIECDSPTIAQFARYSFGHGLSVVEGKIDNSKPSIANVRSFYQAVVRDCKYIKNKNSGLDVRALRTADIIDTLAITNERQVRQPITGNNPNWRAIHAEYLQGTRKSFAWRLAHGIIPRLNYHRSASYVINSCSLCGGSESIKHLFYSCPFLTPVKDKVKSGFGLQNLTYSNIRYLDHMPKNSSARRQLILTIVEITYQTWRMRCDISHGMDPPDETAFLAKCWNEIKWTLKREKHRLSATEFGKKWMSPAMIFDIQNGDLLVKL